MTNKARQQNIFCTLVLQSSAGCGWTFNECLAERKADGRYGQAFTTFFMLQKYKFGFLILFIILVSGCNSQPKIRFDKNKWLASNSIRYQMLDDVVKSKMVLHKRHDEVISILGKPDYRWDSLGRWQYGAGAAPMGLGISFYSLNIKFKNGLVDSAIIIERHD